MADADHVTGLATRAAFESYLVERLPQPGLAVLLVDVVGLKRVNEEQGFLTGDSHLCAAAQRLQRAAAQAALVARLGGDELVAVFAGPEAAAQAHDAACGLDGRAGEPVVRAALAVTTAADTRETLINRLYATVRRS